MSIFDRRISIDLGSSRTRIYVPRKGLVVDEPTVVALNKDSERITAIGFEALDMIGRTPEKVTAYYPLKRGVIADYQATSKLLKAYLQQATGRFHLKKPEAMMTISDTATSTEQRALIDAGKDAGLENVYLIPSNVAAALGAGLPITDPKGNFIIDIGAGTTEIGVFSLGGVIAKQAIRVGGEAIDDALARALRREYGLKVGVETVHELKNDFLDVSRDSSTKKLDVHGQSALQSLPRSVTIKNDVFAPYVESVLERMLISIRRVLERTPPDILADVIKHGVLLSGGTAQLKGLDDFLSRRLRLSFIIAQDPLLCSVKGANMALTHLKDYKRSLLEQ